MEKSYVIIGEASESDTEEEIDSSETNINNLKTKSSQGVILSGEASESDEDITNKISLPKTSPLVANKEVKKNDISKKYQIPNYESLLHKKLRERNIGFHKNLNDFVNTILSSALKDLNATNQHLLKSQCHLQEASTSLRILHSNLNHLNSNLSLIANDSFLSNIKIKRDN